jgi:hypothetical protein
MSTEASIYLEKLVYPGKANSRFNIKVSDTLEDAINPTEVGFEFHAEIVGAYSIQK